MRGYVTDTAGRQWLLPQPTAWRMEYTAGTPCDSFWMRCPWEAGSGTKPGEWSRFWAEHGGERVFTGVVDECQVEQSGNGSVLELSGRGMAALLLDNEALGQDYGTATLEDILRDHVRPYGIQAAAGAKLPPVSPFSVATGSSEWSVVYDFARYYGGAALRFDREGRLVLTGWPERAERLIGDGTAVTELVYRDRRYGVLSQVLVRDRYSGQNGDGERRGIYRPGGHGPTGDDHAGAEQFPDHAVHGQVSAGAGQGGAHPAGGGDRGGLLRLAGGAGAGAAQRLGPERAVSGGPEHGGDGQPGILDPTGAGPAGFRSLR